MDEKEILPEEEGWESAFHSVSPDPEDPDFAGDDNGEDAEEGLADASNDTEPAEKLAVEPAKAPGGEPAGDTGGSVSDEVEPNASAADAKSDAYEVLERLRALDPSIQSFKDLEDVGLFAILLNRGVEPEEALRISSPKLRARAVEQVRAASKQHMRATAASVREDAVPMSVINQFRAARPELSQKEAIALYRRVNGK